MKTSFNFFIIAFVIGAFANVNAQTEYQLPSIKSVKGKTYQLPALLIDAEREGTFWFEHPSNYSGIYGNGVIGIINKKIAIIDLYSKKITFEYPLSDFVNNDIAVIDPVESLMGFSCINDTLIFYNNEAENITLAKLTRDGLTLINKYNLSKENSEKWHRDWSVFSTSVYEPIIINNDINLLRISYKFSYLESSFYEFPHNWQFNISKNPTTGFSNISNYPLRYKQGNFGMMFIPQRVFNENKNQLIFGYPADPEMQTFSLATQTYSSVNVKSYFQTKDIPFIAKGEKLGSEGKFKDLYTRDQYTNLIYDKFNRCYYRFLRLGLEVTSDSTCTWCMYKKPLVVMILDENLSIIDEILFENTMYSELNSFAGPEGLYLACTGWNNNKSKLKYSTYDILNWHDQKTLKSEQSPNVKCYVKDGFLKLTGSDLNLPETKLIITICNTAGVWVLREIITENGIDVSSLSKGLYLVRISGSNWSSVQKIEIN